MAYDGRAGRSRLWVAPGSPFWGTTLRFSDDFGASWSGKDERSVRFPEDSELSLKRIWQIRPGSDAEPDVIHLGVEPACLFESRDAGDIVAAGGGAVEPSPPGALAAGRGRALPAHHRRGRGAGRAHDDRHLGGGRLPERQRRGHVGGAQPWRARGVPPRQAPRVRPVRAQDHASSHEPRSALPAEPLGALQERGLGGYLGRHRKRGSLGFRLRHGDALPGIPTPSTSCPSSRTASAARRTRSCACTGRATAGASWHPLTEGLPQENAYETVLRDALATLAPGQVFFGTRSGKVYASRDDGDSWELVRDGLPPVVCVKACVA